MAIIDWNRIEEANRTNSTKEYIENLLRHLESEELVVSLTQEFVTSVVDTNDRSVALRLLTFRILFSALPTRVFGKLVVPQNVLEWVCSIIQNTSEYSHSVRGTAITVFTIIMRHFSAGNSFDFSTFTTALIASIRDASVDFDRLVSEEEASCSAGSILLHQIVSALSVVADSSLPWLKELASALPSVATIVLRVSGYNGQRGGRLQVEAAKLFSLVAEVWMAQQPSDPVQAGVSALLVDDRTSDSAAGHVGVGQAVLLGVPRSLFLMVSRGAVLHDSLLAAYQLALEVSMYLQLGNGHPDTAETSVSGLGALHWVTLVEERITSALSFSSEGEGGGEMADLCIKRVECLLGLLAAWFDTRATHRETLQRVWQDENEWLSAADGTLRLVLSAMQHLKNGLPALTISASAKKSCRAAAGDLRKGCIALSHTVLTACPSYLVRRRLTYAGETAFLSFSVRGLGTPLLFGAAYTALKEAGVIGGQSGPVEEDEGTLSPEEARQFVWKMVRHVFTGLGSTSRYSAGAAGDILSAVEDLAVCGCVDLLDAACCEDLPLGVLQAMQAAPKGLGKACSQKKGASKTDVEGLDDWQIRCCAVLQELFRLAGTCDTPFSSFSRQFQEQFVMLVVKEIQTLRRCLGIQPTPPLPSPPAEVGLQHAATTTTKQAYGTTDAEVLIPVLQALTNALSQFLNLYMHTPSAIALNTSWPCAHTNEALLVLTQDMCSTASRPLLFDDDCVLCCSELEVISRAAIVLLYSSDDSQNTSALLQTVLGVLRTSARGRYVGSMVKGGSPYGCAASANHNEQVVRELSQVCLDVVLAKIPELHEQSLK